MKSKKQILVINAGSSSIKVSAFLLNNDSLSLVQLYHAQVKELFSSNAVFEASWSQRKVKLPQEIFSYEKALEFLLNEIFSQKEIEQSFDVIGHRVVHGGKRFQKGTLIDEDVLNEIRQLASLAPLHNPISVACIESARRFFPSSIPHVAVFDTSFHSQIEDYVTYYPIPLELSRRYQIKRYGFHGISHAALWEKYVNLYPDKKETGRVITLHLGNGCSLAAVKGGRSLDTTMGFTPLDGLMMGTRSGSLDPAIVSYLCEKEQKTPSEIERILNRESGLLGVSTQSSDMKELLGSYEKEEKARLAVDMFCYRLLKAVGAFIAVLGGVDALIFTGGIGENASFIRKKLLESLSWIGVEIDSDKNDTCHSLNGETMMLITSDRSLCQSFVVAADENRAIAQQAIDLIG